MDPETVVEIVQQDAATEAAQAVTEPIASSLAVVNQNVQQVEATVLDTAEATAEDISDFTEVIQSCLQTQTTELRSILSTLQTAQAATAAATQAQLSALLTMLETMRPAAPAQPLTASPSSNLEVVEPEAVVENVEDRPALAAASPEPQKRRRFRGI